MHVTRREVRPGLMMAVEGTRMLTVRACRSGRPPTATTGTTSMSPQVFQYLSQCP